MVWGMMPLLMKAEVVAVTAVVLVYVLGRSPGNEREERYEIFLKKKLIMSFK